jgi:hypothetical protein
MLRIDKKALAYLFYLGIGILVALPLISTAFGLWGWPVNLLLLLIVFGSGYTSGLQNTAVMLGLGYSAAFLFFGFSVYTQMSFVPFAGLMGVWLSRQSMSTGAKLFWGIATTALLALLPAFGSYTGVDERIVKENVDYILQYYNANGMLAALQQQGMTEAYIREKAAQSLRLYFQITPGLIAMAGLLIYAAAYYIMARLPWAGNNLPLPFSHWYLPRFSLWGANLAIIMYLVGDQVSQNGIRMAGLNLMVIYAGLALIQGMAVLTYFIKSPRIPGILKWGIVLSSLIFTPFSLISIVLLGLFDMGLNFRRLINNGEVKPRNDGDLS